MRQELHRFFRAARGAGVHVSPAESIDAMRAVADVGFANRAILRDTLLLTLAKSEDEKQALGNCFDLFFSQPEVKEDTAPEDTADSTAAGADAAGARPEGDGGGAGERGECRLTLRHPLFYPARHLRDPDPRGTRYRPASRRSGCPQRHQSVGSRTAQRGDRGVA